MAGNSEASVQAGKAAARVLVRRGIDAAADIEDPLDPGFAEAFVRELAAGLSEVLSGVGRDVVEGAGRFVRSNNAERDHGLVEVLQNADDLGATRVLFRAGRYRWERSPAAHCARRRPRARAPCARDDACAHHDQTEADDLTGKFGAGLGTLARIADSFSVDSWPYAFHVRDQRLSLAKAAAPMPGVYDPTRPDTLLTLHLPRELLA